MKLLTSTQHQRLTNGFFAFVLAISSVTAIGSFLFSQNASAAPSVTLCAAGCDATTLQDAIALADANGVITLESNITGASQATITKSLTIEGAGFTLNSPFARTGNDNNSAIGIIGTSNVTINNLTIDGTGGTNLHGVNVYESTSAALNNVTLRNTNRSGLVVNGSTVMVSNIVTSGNGWHGINVDQGTGVTSPAHLTINGISQHAELAPDVYVDNVAEDVSVTDANNQYNIDNTVLKPGDRVYSIRAAAPTILTPSAEQYFSATPIVNSWTTVTYTKGISEYQVEYIYDDGHSFAGGPYRNVPGTQTSRNHTPTVAEQGGVTIRVRAIDAIGNVGTWSTPVHYFYDSIAPVAPVLSSPANNVVVNGASVTQAWTTTDTDVDYFVYESYNDALATSLRWSEPFTATSKTATNIANAEYWWRVKAVDHAGNVSPWSDLWKITIDNDAPVATITSPADSEVLSGVVDIRGSVIDDNLWRYHFVIKNSANATVFQKTVNTSGFTDGLLHTWNTAAVADGVYTIFISSRDLADNKDGDQTTDGVSTDTITVTVDNTAPVVTINSITPVVVGDNAVFGGTMDDPSAVLTFTLDGVEYPTTNDGSTWQAVVSTTGFDARDYIATIMAEDGVGNTSASGATTTTTLTVEEPAPALQEEVLGTDTTPAPLAAPASFVAAPTPSEGDVLGDTTTDLAAQSGLAEVEGASILAQAVNTENDTTDGSFLGLAWYWWVLIVAAIAGFLIWLIAALRRRHSEA